MINSKLPAIYYGGDYNPDQWTEETWQEDMRLFKLAGINLVTLPVFSWPKLQPAEDKFDFEWLDKILDMLAENGIYACLATSTAAQPAWMSLKYPEVLPVDLQGRKRTHGKRVNFCPNSKKYRELSSALARKMAERYKEHPALLLWHIANEYGTYCYCDNCAAEFRKWLKARYGTIEELNKRWNLSFWGHTVYDWEEVVLPSELNDDDKFYQGKALDYMRFMTDSSLGCYLEEYKVLKEMTPDVPITTNISGFIKKLDQFKWADYLDVVGWDNYPSPSDGMSTVAMKHDLMRGLKDGKPYMLVEQTPSQQNWQPYNTLKRPGVMRLMSYQAVAHGADTVLFFQLRRSIGGVEKFHGAVISHAGHENTRVFRECAQLGEELKNLGDSILDSRMKSRVAIIFDWDNWWAVELSSGPSKDLKYFDQVVKYYKAFYDMNISVDMVKPSSDLSKYDIVIAPVLYMIKPGAAKNIENFVSKGGTFVTTFFSGIVNENDLVTIGGYPGELRKLLGIWVEEIDALLPDTKNSIVITEPCGNIKGKYDCELLCDILHLEGAKEVAVYGKDFYAGTPCVTENSYGKGKAYYVATSPDEQFLQDFVKELCNNKGIKAALEVPKGVELTQRFKEDKEFTFILNHNDYAVKIYLKENEYTELITSEKKFKELLLEPKGVVILQNIHG
jgi:beta-galactosidase